MEALFTQWLCTTAVLDTSSMGITMSYANRMSLGLVSSLHVKVSRLRPKLKLKTLQNIFRCDQSHGQEYVYL